LALAGCATVVGAAWIFRDILSFAACTVGFPVLSFGLALLVVAAASPGGVLARIRLPGIRWIAAVSYSLYLSHKAMLKFASTHLPASLGKHGIFSFLCCVVVAMLAAAALHYLVERPFLLLRDRAKRNMAPAAGTEVGDVV
jgi:peptidoglycan/LPS O-acetylase OafA/YrhL